MSQAWRSRAAVAGLIFLVGCGSESETGNVSPAAAPPGSAAPATTENLPLVAHPEYANWSRFPVGTTVVRKKEVASESETVHVTTTLRLIEKTADKVDVERQVSVDRPGRPLEQNPPIKFHFFATFPLPQGMQLEQFSLPSLEAKLVGEEIRAACGREYQAQLFAWEEVNETGPMTVKLWRSNDIPGRMLRQEINGRDHISVEEVVEIIQPGGAALPGA